MFALIWTTAPLSQSATQQNLMQKHLQHRHEVKDFVVAAFFSSAAVPQVHPAPWVHGQPPTDSDQKDPENAEATWPKQAWVWIHENLPMPTSPSPDGKFQEGNSFHDPQLEHNPILSLPWRSCYHALYCE